MARNDGKQTQAESLAILERLRGHQWHTLSPAELRAVDDGIHALRVKLRSNKRKAAYHKSPSPYATIVRGPRERP